MYSVSIVGFVLQIDPVDTLPGAQPDITLAKEKFDWEPGIKLEAGLKPTIKYFSELLGA